MQFKKASKNGRGLFAEIDEKQMLLFSKFPEVSFHGTGSIPKEVLRDPIHKKPQSEAMFAMIEYDKDERKNELRFMNHTKLKPDEPKYKLSDEGKHYYVNEIETKYNPDPKIVPNPDFTFCDYVPSFKDFVDNVKDLKVGREIEIADILHHISKEELPDDLKKYYEENINNPNENDSGNVEDNESNMLVNLVDTIAINVDELVD